MLALAPVPIVPLVPLVSLVPLVQNNKITRDQSDLRDWSDPIEDGYQRLCVTFVLLPKTKGSPIGLP